MNRPYGDRIRPAAVDTRTASLDPPTVALPTVTPAAAASPMFEDTRTPADVAGVVGAELDAAERRIHAMRAGLIQLHRDALHRLDQLAT